MTSTSSRLVTSRGRRIARANECIRSAIALSVTARRVSAMRLPCRRTNTARRLTAASRWPRRDDSPRAAFLFTSRPTIAAQLAGAVPATSTWAPSRWRLSTRQLRVASAACDWRSASRSISAATTARTARALCRRCYIVSNLVSHNEQ